MHARPDGPLAAAINRKINEARVWLSRHAAIGRCPGGQNAYRSPFSPRTAPQMDDQRGQGHQDKTGEPPLIERVAAQMPVERVIDRMNCPATMKPTSATPMLSDHISESSTLTPMPIWKAPTSCSRCLL
jgi:hypothetical protein